MTKVIENSKKLNTFDYMLIKMWEEIVFLKNTYN